MKWITHIAVPLAAGTALGAPLSLLAGLGVGSVLPDVVDRVVSCGNQQVWRRIHRGPSHWFGWYVALTLVGLVMGSELNEALRTLLLDLKGVLPRDVLALLRKNAGTEGLLLGIGLGALSHLALDALNPSGIPVYPFSQKPRMGKGLVSTGTPGEYVFLAAALLLFGMNAAEVFQKVF